MKKTVYILLVFFAYLVALFFYLCFDFLYYSPVTTNVIIVKDVLDKAPPSVDVRKEIKRYLDFSFDYFLKNFNVKFILKDISVLTIPKNNTFEYKDFKPHNERLTIVFQNGDGGDYGTSTVGRGKISMIITFHEYSNELHKWILLHEICHQYNTIDLIDDQSVMNGYLYNEVANIVKDGTVAKQSRIKEIDPLKELCLDSRSRDIIQASKRYYALGTDGFANYFFTSSKRIVAHYEALLPNARHQSDVNYKLAGYFYQNNDFGMALKYALSSVRYNDNEDISVSPPGFMGNLPLDEKYFLLTCIYAYINQRDMAIDSLEKSIAVNNTNRDRLNILSGLYLGEIPKEVWSGEIVEKLKKVNEKMAELDPKDPNPYFLLSMIYMGQENIEKRDEYFDKLFSLNPSLGKVQKKDGYVSLKIVDATDTESLAGNEKPFGMTHNIYMQYE